MTRLERRNELSKVLNKIGGAAKSLNIVIIYIYILLTPYSLAVRNSRNQTCFTIVCSSKRSLI